MKEIICQVGDPIPNHTCTILQGEFENGNTFWDEFAYTLVTFPLDQVLFSSPIPLVSMTYHKGPERKGSSLVTRMEIFRQHWDLRRVAQCCSSEAPDLQRGALSSLNFRWERVFFSGGERRNECLKNWKWGRMTDKKESALWMTSGQRAKGNKEVKNA